MHEINGYKANLKWRFHRSKLGEKKIKWTEVVGWALVFGGVWAMISLYKLL